MQESVISYNPLNDYRLIIDLPAAVKQKIGDTKTVFDEQYKGTVIAGGPSLIYLAEFGCYEAEEEAVTDQINKVALGFMPFKLHLKGFQHLEQKEIYIGVCELAPLQLLTAQIDKEIVVLPNARINVLPRVTIARGLHLFQFGKSWPLYQQKNFSATFIADEMLLLKRMQGFSGWQILKRMNFQNLLVAE